MTRTRKAPFKVGDRVTSHFIAGEESIVRRITQIERDDGVEHGWVASADAGEPCSTCGRCGTPIQDVSAWWFREVTP